MIRLLRISLLFLPLYLVGEEATIKGFAIHEGEHWYISDQPKQKSCCAGVVKPKKTELSALDFPLEEGKVYTLRGQIVPGGKLQVIEVKGDETDFTILIVLIIVTAMISYIYLKKKP